MPVAARFQTAGCVAAVALLLAGCSGGGSTGTETTAAAVTSDAVTTTPQRPVPKHKKPAAGPCQIQLGSFVASMDSLRRRLAVGVTYDQYVAEVRGIRSTYKKIPIDQVEIDCLSAVGTPAEQAFNRYIEAANDWGDCVSEAGCGSETVEPVLQRRWRIASHFLGEADEGLSADAP
ncbi:MAG TPA: hypothetical protein VLC07_01200 [Solirubrobacterales bacterium]|nr:hypothetical protein [Solirubrobacterales bacterium]